MRWFSMELSKVEWSGIRPTLEELGCRYEASGCDTLVHVEVYCTPDVASTINAEIDNL